jgi:hypothetical protein
VGWGSTARSGSAPLVGAALGASGGRGTLVGAEHDGSEFVELLDLGWGEGSIVDAESLLRYPPPLHHLHGRNAMSKLRARLVGLVVLTYFAPAAFAADYGTGGGVGAEAPNLAPLPPRHPGEQAAPAPQSDDTGATTDKSTDGQDQTPVAPPADQQK